MNSNKHAADPNTVEIAPKSKSNERKSRSSKRHFEPELIKKMKGIIAKYTDVPHLLDHIETLSDDTDINFIKELNIDSVDVVEIVVDVEEEFGIAIADDELKSFRSFGDMYQLVETKLSEVSQGT